GAHQVGDVLILSTFTQGGQISTIQAYEWAANGTLNQLMSGIDCLASTGVDTLCATVNSVSTSAPWPYAPKTGAAGAFPPGNFFEGGINITQFWRSIGATPGCFSSFLAETRSSSSLGAQLKDFALRSFNLCDAQVSLTPASSAGQAGMPQTITALAQKRDASTGFSLQPAAGATVTATLTNTLGATATFLGGNT